MTGRFLGQLGELAGNFGWSPGDLFDVPRDGAMGVVWWLKGTAVTALGPEHACVGQPAYDRVTRREWVNPYSRPLADFGAPAKDHATSSWPMSAFVLAAPRVQRRSDMVSAMSDDDKKAAEATADGTNRLKHIGGSQSESSPHTRSANGLADGIASQVALARRFNIRAPQSHPIRRLTSPHNRITSSCWRSRRNQF
jgi:hypothetical protein